MYSTAGFAVEADGHNRLAVTLKKHPKSVQPMGSTSDEGEHRFRDEAEQFQADPGKVFGFAGMISTS